MSQTLKSLCWLRRDLRLKDNRALFSACLSPYPVVIAFVFDPLILKLLKNKEDKRVMFIFESLKYLNLKLKHKGSGLLILYGDPVQIIPQLCDKLKIQQVFVNQDYESYAKKRDFLVKQKLKKKGVDFYSFKDQVVFSGKEISKADGTPYRVFTPYKKSWLKKLSFKDLKAFNPNFKNLLKHSLTKNKIQSLKNIGFKKTTLPVPAGELAALNSLKRFSKKIKNYHLLRDQFNLDGTSKLSVHLRFGTISIRQCVLFALKYKSYKGARVWLSELIWREFYQMILDCFNYVENKAFLKKYQNLKWPNNRAWFKAWCKAKTGYPLVDAAMRQLNQEGYMPNRLRMVVASFLTKHLLVDWRQGEAYFAKKLLDFDKASNNGGWQWSASTGCDAQPYFRIFNPISQSQKFDPKGIYIKTWLTELKILDTQAIHFPLKAKQLPPCFKLGKDYPFPIVDHKTQRQKAIRLFKNQKTIALKARNKP